MKIGGFRYSVEMQTAGKWQSIVSGDDLELLTKMFDKTVASKALRLVDRSTEKVIASRGLDALPSK